MVEINKLEKHISFLATAASVAPFIGLFGTVWGIMTSFQGIGQTGSTNLGVVAPGIADALVATAAGLAAAIPAVWFYNILTQRVNDRGSVFVDTHTVPVTEPTAVPTATTPTVNTATLPTAPEPTTTTKSKRPKGAKNGRFVWPRNENGWTIVLVSYPKTNGRPTALQTASRAARAGLQQVGVLDSSRYASLQPGYYVVFTGVYPAKTDADTAVATARQAGFGGAYSRQIAR